MSSKWREYVLIRGVEAAIFVALGTGASAVMHPIVDIAHFILVMGGEFLLVIPFALIFGSLSWLCWRLCVRAGLL